MDLQKKRDELEAKQKELSDLLKDTRESVDKLIAEANVLEDQLTEAIAKSINSAHSFTEGSDL
jgi:uncharacterized coiled-coil DUF342 family protein